KRPEVRVVPERQAAVSLVHGVETVAAGARHQLGDAGARLEALHVVLVAVQNEHRMTAKRVPERLDVGLVAVLFAGAVPRSVPEGDPARARTLQLCSKPAELWRSGIVEQLGVETDELPATGRERVVVGNASAPCLLP